MTSKTKIERRRVIQAGLALGAVAAVGCGSDPNPEATPEPSASTSATGSGKPGAKLRNELPKRKEPEQVPPPEDVAGPPADATKTESGLFYKNVKKGTGTEHPTADDTVTVHYTGWTKDGKTFDSSRTRKNPATFSLRQVIKGWTEGVQLMVVGDQTRFWIPGNLAYGDEQKAPGKPFGQLTFDVELIEIKKAAAPKKPEEPAAIPAPEDVAEPPKDAKKTKSGIAYKVLTKGTGKKHPKAENEVEVHYTGWTKDGKMFDSSVQRKETAKFQLTQVIKGWTEGVQLMVEGEKTRFWIPAELGYGEKPKPGYPAGQLTFDVELIKIL
jgi:FKBP-type peptidyl-prolyl cis-trans isomerase